MRRTEMGDLRKGETKIILRWINNETIRRLGHYNILQISLFINQNASLDEQANIF